MSSKSRSSSRVKISTRAKSAKKDTVRAAVTPSQIYREGLEKEDKTQTTMTQFAH